MQSAKFKIQHYFTATALLCSLAIFLLGARAAAAQEVIDSFAVEIQVNQDATIEVTERIVYDFGADQRHGIFRTIPISYKARGGTYRLRVSDVAVADEEGVVQPFTTSTPGSNLEIKIGDPDRFVSGQQTYVISYTVDRALNYFDDHDELYWNVTGEEWPVAMNQAAALVAVEGTTAGDLQTACFAGSRGSSTPCTVTTLTEPGALFQQMPLRAQEGLTVVVGWPKGVIYEPSFAERVGETARDNWVVALPLVTLGLLWHWWRRRGRDPKGRGTIVVQYQSPTGLSPAQVGTIVDESAHNVDLTAEIIDLAVRGYLKIVRDDKRVLLFKKDDWRLEKLKESDGGLNKPQQLLFKKLFDGKQSVELSDLKREFSQDWQAVRTSVYRSVVEDGYFPHNPRVVRIVYGVIGMVVAFGGVAIGLMAGIIAAVSLLVTGVLIVLFGLVMPVKTKKGVLAYEHILGLKRYLSVAEKDRLKFHNAPEKRPEHFDSLLPYAMALGVEKEWAKQFEGMDRKPPGWYEGPSGSHLAMAALASDMSSFASAAGTSLSASASSGSSGFSGGSAGGGFGGGGGGSW